MRFEIDDFTGEALTSEEVMARHSKRVTELQRVAFRHFSSELSELALSNVSAVDTEESLRTHLSALNDDQLRRLCNLVHLPVLPPPPS
jgi:intron-binding protein aquarius